MSEKNLSKKEVLKRLLVLAEVSALVGELYKGKTRLVRRWLTTPNSAFSKNTPLEVIFQGNGRQVIRWLRPRVSRESAIAF